MRTDNPHRGKKRWSRDIGRKVIYTGNRHPGGELEHGTIASFNAHSVFVRYHGDVGSKGTSRADLEWQSDSDRDRCSR
jgi:hypothetical protein